jgi:beta-lactamase class A
MAVTRRTFLAGTAATAGVASLGLPGVAAGAGEPGLANRIIAPFLGLPGNASLKIVAPRHGGGRALLIEHNASKRLFIGSAFKSFVLCEALRQADSPDVVETIASRQLALDESVWSPDSPSFNPPHLSGMVSERTAMEAMVLHSDNTGADMLLKLVRPHNVRRFIRSIGLENTTIPDSTRELIGYLLGAPNYQKFSWQDYVDAQNSPFVNSPLNNVVTMASTADDLVSYYSRGLQGEFFENQATLNPFREILAMGDAIWLLPFPLGVSAFVKGGAIDVPGFHALCVPGGMFFDGRWVYFCMTLNWFASAQSDPATVGAFVVAARNAMQLVKNALSAK